jgi:hypothetical protein
MGQTVKTEFKWNRPPKQIIDDKVLRNGATLKFMAVTWHKLYYPFVPKRTGALVDTVEYSVNLEKQTGIIHHKAPYARRQYHGKGFNFSFLGQGGESGYGLTSFHYSSLTEMSDQCNPIASIL